MHGIGYSAGSDMAEYQAHVFISAQLCEKWAPEFFFPHLDNVRQKLEYRPWGTLSLGDCFCRDSDEFLDMS
jgi:hypothetical protein